MQPTANLTAEQRFLAHGAAAGSGATALEGAFEAKTPFITPLEPNFCHRQCLAFIGTILVYLRQHFEVPVALPMGREPSKINLIGIDQNYRLAPQAACKVGAALFWGHGFWVQFWGAIYLDAVTLFTDF